MVIISIYRYRYQNCVQKEKLFQFIICVKISVADPHYFDADPDPDFHFDAEPDPDPAFSQYVKKSHFFWFIGLFFTYIAEGSVEFSWSKK